MLGFESSRRLILCGTMFAAIVLMASGCGNPVKRKVESRIESALPRLLGPAKSYEVSVSGPTVGMLKGRLRSAHIVGTDVQLPNGIVVSRLEVVSNGIVIDRHRHQISNVDETKYSALLAQDALNKYLSDTYRYVPRLKTELGKDRLRVFASPEVAGVQVHISADAALKVKENRYLILDLKDVAVVGVDTPGFAREYFENRINPVFDSTNFGYDARVHRVTIRPGGLTLEGTLDIAKQLNVASRPPRTKRPQLSASASP